ncbi:MAG: UvrD-helicase domain-containing protein [Candidatus Hydrogenedentales bacterium]
MGLNPEQQAAVTCTDGPLLILAGAGTGKTRVITRRIAHLIAQQRATPDQILAVTFTNKAAQEMRERVAELVGRDKARKVTLSTFHAFCLQVLRRHSDRIGYRRNFTVAGESDVYLLLRRILGDLDGVRESFSPATFRERISLIKNSGEDAPSEALPTNGNDATAAPSETELKYQTWLPSIYEGYDSALRAANAVDFDDLLRLTDRLWREHANILEQYQARFRYVMVDEYQDTNMLQYRLVRHLVAKHRNLCVVGDDDQSIYGWRGADVRNILEFERDFPDATVVTLNRNYRSTGTILKAANAVIAHNQARRPKELHSELDVGRPIDWLVAGDDEHEAKSAVAWLEHVRSRAGAGYSDFAMLYRSNTQSRPLEIALRQKAIPYTVVGGQEFFERAEVRDVISYLKVIANPRDEAAFLRVVNMPRRGIGDVTLHGLHDLCRERGMTLGQAMAAALESQHVNKTAAEGMRRFLSLLTHFRQRFKSQDDTLSNLTRELVESIQYREELRRTCKHAVQAEARWENVEAVIRAVAQFEAATTKPTLKAFLDASALNSDGIDRGGDEKRRGVTLMTIHSAKGLEFPFVFLMGCEESVLPHEKSLQDNGLEEERRLFYVAVTRARRHLTVFEALSRVRNGRERMCTTSRFLLDIPEALVRKRVLAARDMVEERVEPQALPPKSPRRRKAGAAKRKPKRSA